MSKPERSKSAVGRRIRELRDRRGWSAQDLATACAAAAPPGTVPPSRSTLAKIEAGVRRDVRMTEVEIIARAFGVEITELTRADGAPAPVPAPRAGEPGGRTVLLVAGPRFDRSGPKPAEDAVAAAGRVLAALPAARSAALSPEDGAELRCSVPELVVVAGDLTANGSRTEFEAARAFLGALADGLGLAPERIVVVPGEGDVSRAACRSYFDQCEADDVEPEPPYWPK